MAWIVRPDGMIDFNCTEEEDAEVSLWFRNWLGNRGGAEGPGPMETEFKFDEVFADA